MIKLENGMVFKNYKALCEFMEWKVYKGGSNSQKAQIKILDSMCDWHKEGNKIIVDEVYEVRLASKDGRINNTNAGVKSEFQEDMEIALMAYFNSKKDRVLVCSKAKLMENLGFVNGKFIAGKYDSEELSIKKELDRHLVMDWFDRTQSNLTDSIDSILEKMKKKSMIVVNDVIIITQKVPRICENEYGIQKVEYEFIEMIATDDIHSYLLDVEAEVAYELGYASSGNAMFSKDGVKFWDRVNKIVKDRFNISKYYRAKKIILGKLPIKMQLENYGKERVTLAIENINKIAVDRSLGYNKSIARKTSNGFVDDNITKLNGLSNEFIKLRETESNLISNKIVQ